MLARRIPCPQMKARLCPLKAIGPWNEMRGAFILFVKKIIMPAFLHPGGSAHFSAHAWMCKPYKVFHGMLKRVIDTGQV